MQKEGDLILVKEKSTFLSDESKTARHPCYSEEAHHHFARMHVAVAPKCNISCNFCSRKFDCANESRPGVVSELITPDEAVRKVLFVASGMKQLSVVGIAGPGDPLANPEKTFATFKGIAEQAPDLRLCLSTNGLTLLDHIDQIKALSIDHITITINAVDPEIGKEIYSWIYYKKKRYKGLEAAKILIDRQLRGLEALVSLGVLVKVNSVLIPGINADHLAEVSEVIGAKGAFIHNIVPLIVTPDTVFEKNGIKNPTAVELQAVQEKCQGDSPIKMMKHCHQCRADAIGLLGEDRSPEFTKEEFLNKKIDYNIKERADFQHQVEQKIRRKKEGKEDNAILEKESDMSVVRIAVTTRGEGKVNLHFGHAKDFLVFDVSETTITFIGVRKVQSYCVGGVMNCGSDKLTILDETKAILSDCQILLSSGMGAVPQKYMRDQGIIPVIRSGDMEVLLHESEKYYRYMNPEPKQQMEVPSIR